MTYIEREKVCEICNNKGDDCGKEKCPVYKVPTADVAPRAEVARKIFEEIEDLMREWFDFFRQDNDIREASAIMAALSQISELKKKYTEDQHGKRTDH